MKKLISFVLSLLLVLPFAGAGMAYWNENWDPPGDWLGYNGQIYVVFQHLYSCTLRDYTAEDFPKLEIESITNYPPNKDLQTMKNNPDYRRRVTITLKDKSEEAIRSAVYYLDSLSSVYHCMALADVIKEGDVNCDRNVNLRDASHMLKHIAGWENATIEYFRTGDMNWDETINLEDVAILLQVIAGWDGWADIGFTTGPY